MASGNGEKNDFYAVLGLQKECTDEELRNAYKKLALRWHPDRCSALGNLKRVEEAKKKFQDIQEAYSVLSDANKRFMYDVGVYEGDEDDANGMGDFLNEMADMMCQHKSNGGGNESFKELQDMFDEMFQNETSSNCNEHGGWWPSSSSSCSSSSKSSFTDHATSETPPTTTNSTKTKLGKSTSFDAHFDTFSFGTGATSRNPKVEGGSRRRKKVSRTGRE
ncbi:dnaJ homolog subfamily B member 6 isoform X2 [Impatiens glandulifera]|uniref:dnaJ homolog subfamily B member 6 isoform X2 n=1 Tax=Impatiens glandulifera TaxID=253017 RepID=UPI001FB0AA2B|nr:dnaJ homolog subfamily B member 6 isoform X2 [Impatiens glandulifera]